MCPLFVLEFLNYICFNLYALEGIFTKGLITTTFDAFFPVKNPQYLPVAFHTTSPVVRTIPRSLEHLRLSFIT